MTAVPPPTGVSPRMSPFPLGRPSRAVRLGTCSRGVTPGQLLQTTKLSPPPRLSAPRPPPPTAAFGAWIEKRWEGTF